MKVKIQVDPAITEEYAEFHVDDEALYQMILDTFYVKK